MTPPRGRTQLPGAGVSPFHLTILAVLLIHAAGHFAYMGIWRHLTAPDFDVNDFKAYYTAGLALRTGQAREFLYSDPAQLNLGLLPVQPWVDFATSHGVPHPSAYIYPPLFAVAIAPLTALPYHEANLAWYFLNTAFLAGSIALLAGLCLEARGANAGRAVAVSAVVLACLHFFPTIRALQCGQVGLVMLILLAASLRLLLSSDIEGPTRRRNDALAGLCLATAAAIKLTPLLLILWLFWAGRRRAALWGAGGFVALTLASVASVGWNNLWIFVTGFLPALSRGAATYANQSVNGFLNRLFTPMSVTVFDFADEPAAVRWISRAAAAGLAALAFWVSRPKGLEGEGDRRCRLALGFGLVVMTSLIVSPISWEHHYVLALIPLAVMIHDVSLRGTVKLAVLVSLSYAAMAVDASENIRKNLGLPDGLARIALSYVLFGALLLWLLTALRLTRRGREA